MPRFESPQQPDQAEQPEELSIQRTGGLSTKRKRSPASDTPARASPRCAFLDPFADDFQERMMANQLGGKLDKQTMQPNATTDVVEGTKEEERRLLAAVRYAL